MQVSIDKAGRLILPKPLRDRFGLQPDTRLDLVVSSEGIVLKPADAGSEWKRDENGHLVYSGRLPAKVAWNSLVDEMREERMREIGGW
jgi:AbrB family looped-hinge helix DNA binding protein